jgi:hypothetical protein
MAGEPINQRTAGRDAWAFIGVHRRSRPGSPFDNSVDRSAA